MSTIQMGTNLFPAKLIPTLISMVKGKSSIARLSASEPIAFTGQKYFTFNLDDEMEIAGESGAKSAGSGKVGSKTVVPVKVVYSQRVSDEFLNAAEEDQLDVLNAFVDGFAKKQARALDIMAFHGVNPRTKQASEIIGTNCFDKAVTQIVTQTADADADAQVEAAIALVQNSENDVTGMAMSPVFKSELAAIKKSTGDKLFPELAWGSNVGSINGLAVDANSTVSYANTKDKAIVGDFANMLKYGYSKEIPLEVIAYGDPDNTGKDLKGQNEVCLRSEAYIGWAILDETAFALIQTGE